MSVLARIGREVIGPALCLHIHRVIHALDEDAVDRVYFLAREGHLPQRIYSKLAPVLHRRRPPEHDYLHVSKRSTALPALRSFGPREVQLGQAVSSGLNGMLSTFDLLDEEVVALAFRSGIRDLSSPIYDPWSDRRIALLLGSSEFQALVAARAERARGRFLGYLRQHGALRPGRIAVVEVGWSGTIQDSMRRVFETMDGAPEIMGLYFGVFIDSVVEEHIKNKSGLVYHGRGARLRDHAPIHFAPLFEQACRAQEGMTLGYVEREDGAVAPLLAESGAAREAEQRAEQAIAEIQRGAEAAAEEWLDRERTLDAVRLRALREDVRERVLRLVFLPRKDELRALADLTFTDGWGSERWSNVITHEGMLALLKPKQWLHGFYASPWKAAYLAQTGGPAFSWAFRWYEELKTRIGRS